MKNNNEMKMVLKILKNPDNYYNANSISKEMGLSAMGALKIARKLEKDGILASKQIGKGNFYSINFKNQHTKYYLQYILRIEAEHSLPYVKRWISEIRKIKNSELAILFGSVLSKGEKANDIDVLFVTSQKSFKELKKEIEQLNRINDKKIHALFQSKQDIIENIKRRDKIALNALKGLVVFGENILLEVIDNTF